ncbi:MAG: hypothetical protein ACOCV8_03610 [Spirochaetota bacterium]
MKKLILTIIIIIIFSVLVLNLYSQNDYSIVGRWKPFNTDTIINFHQNGDISGPGIEGTYEYNGQRLILNLRRGYKYRTITSVNAYIKDRKLYFAYPGKGYLIGSKNNEGLIGEWQADRRFRLINSKDSYVYEDRYEYIKLNFREGYLNIIQGYDTYEPRNNSYSYKVAYDEVVDHYYFYSIEYPENRTYYEIINLEDRRLLLLSHKYLVENRKTTSVTFNYPYYVRVE